MTINSYSFKFNSKDAFIDSMVVIEKLKDRKCYDVGYADMIVTFFEKKDWNDMLTVLSAKYPQSMWQLTGLNTLEMI